MGSTDSIPIISQLKSVVQVIAGDAEGARKTQENFLETNLQVTQIRSLGYLITGNKQKAKAVQMKFLKNLDAITDGLPFIGHLKGIVHYATGNEEKGDRLMKDATGSLVSVVAGAAGTIAGGPAAGAAASFAASHAYDGLVTGIDTAINGNNEDGSPRYHGSLKTYDRMVKGEADAGEYFDTVGMPLIEAATGRKIGKYVKSKSRKIGSHSLCKRDVDYHLTSDEQQFVTSHQRLPGNASEVITANWQHLSVPQTMSNLVSLFVILRLILWNDKNGRTYSRELCSMTAEYDYIEQCQESLMMALRQMDDHLAKHEKDSEYILNPALVMTGTTGNSSVIMIQSMASLYGILDSMGKGSSIGIIWLTELCIYEDLETHTICEEVVLDKLKELGSKAFNLGNARKNRVKRATGTCSFKKSQKNINVGKHRDVQASNRKKFEETGKRYESNHVPAKSAYPGNPSGNSLPAHSLPKELHQIAMTKVGTSKNSYVAKILRNYEKQLMEKGKIAEAINLDMKISYGRLNSKVNVKGQTTSFKPGSKKYKNDLKEVVNEHRKQGRISDADVNKLNRMLDDESTAWNNIKGKNMQMKWRNWMRRLEAEYEKIVKKNNLQLDPNMHVPQADYHYG